MRRCEEKRKVWTKQCQCDSDEQGVEEKPWKNEELRSLEEGLKRLKAKTQRRATWLLRVVGCDVFLPKMLLDLSEETR